MKNKNGFVMILILIPLGLGFMMVGWSIRERHHKTAVEQFNNEQIKNGAYVL